MVVFCVFQLYVPNDDNTKAPKFNGQFVLSAVTSA